jgi:hypothetical protein
MIWFNYMFKIVTIDPGSVMSDLDHSDFADADHAKTTIRAAVRYLLRGTTDGVRGDILQGIITMVRKVASQPALGQPNPFDDDAPAG